MAQEKLSRKEREHLRRRSEILRVALELFAEKGFHSTSMHEIAEKAEFAVGTLYNFFSNKDEIYQTLIVDMAEKFHGTLLAALETRGGEMLKIKRCMEAKAEVFLNNLSQVRIYFAETQGASYSVKAGLDKKLRALYDEYLQKLTSVFKNGIRKKIFIKFDPHLLAVAIDNISNAFLIEHMEHPGRHSYDAETVMNVFFEKIYTGVGQ